jgi:hypothetical protein
MPLRVVVVTERARYIPFVGSGCREGNEGAWTIKTPNLLPMALHHLKLGLPRLLVCSAPCTAQPFSSAIWIQIAEICDASIYLTPRWPDGAFQLFLESYEASMRSLPQCGRHTPTQRGKSTTCVRKESHSELTLDHTIYGNEPARLGQFIKLHFHF